jgi:hypothetical protein
MSNYIETIEQLEGVLAKQTAAIDALKGLVEAMHTKLLTYIALVDDHELVLEKVGIRKAARENENSGGVVH